MENGKAKRADTLCFLVIALCTVRQHPFPMTFTENGFGFRHGVAEFLHTEFSKKVRQNGKKGEKTSIVKINVSFWKFKIF